MLILSRRRLMTGAVALTAYAALESPARAAVALVTHSLTAGGVNGGSSPAVDTTGATLLVVQKVYFGQVTEPVLTDSKGNTWTALTPESTITQVAIRLYYAVNPIVGSGHTITLTGTGSLSVGFFQAFSGVLTISPLDVSNGSASGISTSTINVAPGLTPSQNNSLIVSGVGWAAVGDGPFSINSGFSITDQHGTVSSTAFGGGAAYFVQGTAAISNPTWTNAGTAGPAAMTLAVFKPAVASGRSRLIQ